MPFEALPDFWAVLERRPEVGIVLGSRVQLLGRDIRRTAARHYFGRFFATAAYLVLRVPVYDTQCGAKIFRACDQTHRIFQMPFRTQWIFDVELLARYLAYDGAIADRAEGKIYELALRSWHDIEGSKVHGRDVPRAFLDLVRIWGLTRQRNTRLSRAPSEGRTRAAFRAS